MSEELDKYKMPRTYGGIIPVIIPIESPNLNDFGKMLAGFFILKIIYINLLFLIIFYIIKYKNWKINYIKIFKIQ